MLLLGNHAFDNVRFHLSLSLSRESGPSSVLSSRRGLFRGGADVVGAGGGGGGGGGVAVCLLLVVFVVAGAGRRRMTREWGKLKVWWHARMNPNRAQAKGGTQDDTCLE